MSDKKVIENQEKAPIEGQEEQQAALKLDDPVNMMIFRVGTQDYCMPVSMIREIRCPKKLTPIPRAPSFVLGATNLRGEIPVVLNLADLLGVAAQENNKRRVAIMMEHNNVLTGLVVDEVLRMQELDMAEETNSKTEECVKGTIIADHRIICILDVNMIIEAVKH